MKRNWERLDDEEKENLKHALIDFFERERNEKIGVIAAEEIVNFFLQHAGGKIFNKGVDAAKQVLHNRMEELNYDLDDLYALD